VINARKIIKKTKTSPNNQVIILTLFKKIKHIIQAPFYIASTGTKIQKNYAIVAPECLDSIGN